METQGKMYQQLRFSREFFDSIIVDAKTIAEKYAKGHTFRVLTFQRLDFFFNTITCIVTNYPLDSVVVAAPQTDIDEAVAYVIKNNPHLQFGMGQRGYNGDDFVYNEISQVLKIILIYEAR